MRSTAATQPAESLGTRLLRHCWKLVGNPVSAAVLGFGIATLVVLWLLTLRQIDLERELALQAEIDKNSNLVLAHAERASRSIQVLDQVLLAVRTDYLRHGSASDLADLVQSLWTDPERLGVVALVDENGEFIVSTPTASVNVRDRDYFQHHQAVPEDRLLVGKPVLGRVVQDWVVTLSRRISKPDGTFGGVVILSISPLYFARQYELATQGPYGSMALIGLDGITRARRNADRVSFGEDSSRSQLFQELTGRPEGHYIGVAASDGVRRLAAYRSLTDYPLVAVVASSYEDVLAITAGREQLYRTAALGGTLVVLLASISGVGYLARRRRVETAINASEKRYRQLFEGSLDAVMSTSSEGLIVSANPAAQALFRLDASALTTTTRNELLDASDPRVGDLLQHEATERTFVGAVRMVRKDGTLFEAEISSTVNTDQGGLTSMIVRDVTERKQADDQIRELAFYDPLTKLPNRRLLMDRMQVAMAYNHRRSRHGALLFIDLDNFKVLNDTLGHRKGDELLQQVAARLVTCVREGDTCARFGGDEFVVMLADLSGEDFEAAQQARAVGMKILATLGTPYELDGIEHHTTPSIGVTLFSAPEGTAEDPLMRADLAMYQAKSAGRNALCFFDPQLQASMAQRAALEKDLREALRAQQFVLHYQPQVQGDGEVCGVEALMRWRHPDRGLIAPGEFIPIAEETGLIVPMGLWVLEQACTQLALWARDPDLARLHLSVNVSERQFRQTDFVQQVLEILERTGANAKLLRLEITEGLLIVDIEEVVSKMSALKAAGVGFELDDFGTGYSSLSYLKLLPLDRLKIDQSFVRDVLTDPNDAAIAKMVILLATSLGLGVIAEGVETEAQRDFLASHGCHHYQGYLFSKPVEGPEFERWVRTRRTAAETTFNI
jgi:diguanylate cyclase (GGDEF)-like protein/PAS domain S-box-containing protein